MTTDFITDINTENQFLMNDMIEDNTEILDYTVMTIPSLNGSSKVEVHLLEKDNSDVELGFYFSSEHEIKNNLPGFLDEIGSVAEFVEYERGEGYWRNVMDFVYAESKRLRIHSRLVCATTGRILMRDGVVVE